MSMVEALQGYRSEQMTSIQPHSRFTFYSEILKRVSGGPRVGKVTSERSNPCSSHS
jgi:hypothetical protein